MVTENKKSESSDTVIEKKQEKIMNMAKNYAYTLECAKNLGRESLGKISEIGSTGTAFLKSKPYWESLKNNSQKIKEKTYAHGVKFKKNSPKFYKKISHGFFYFFESIIGRIKLGTQYGTASLDILERLAKLKELGILTEEEFTNKKKKLLERI